MSYARAARGTATASAPSCPSRPARRCRRAAEPLHERKSLEYCVSCRAERTASPGARLDHEVSSSCKVGERLQPRAQRPAGSSVPRSGRAAPPSPPPSPGSRATTRDRRRRASRGSMLPVAHGHARTPSGNDRFFERNRAMPSSRSKLRQAPAPSAASRRAARRSRASRRRSRSSSWRRAAHAPICARSTGASMRATESSSTSPIHRWARRRILDDSPPRSRLRVPANSCTRRPAASGSRAAAGVQGSSTLWCHGWSWILPPWPISSCWWPVGAGFGLERRLDVRDARAELAQPSPRARGPRRCAGSPARPAAARGGCRGGRRRARARQTRCAAASPARRRSRPRARRSRRRGRRRAAPGRAAGSGRPPRRVSGLLRAQPAFLPQLERQDQFQNRKYRCAIGRTFAGSQASSSPSARTS